MARTMHDMEDELAKIWALVGELSEQLAANRTLVTQLKSRSDNVKGQAVHVGAGFPLRRFNVDISDEEFATELEAFASHLVTENQQLQHENKQLNTLLKEYEQTLETVMGKFRGVAHASQQHEMQLHSYYTSLLHQLQTAHSSAQLHDDTTLSLLLSRLSVMLRTALRVSEGEEVEPDSDSGIAGLPAIPGAALGLLGAPSSSSGTLSLSGSGSGSGSGPSSSSPPSSPARSTNKSRIAANGASTLSQRSARGRAPHFPGSLPGSSGGYKGTDGHADWAIERETEIQRLSEENAFLRDMLQIAKDSVLPSVVEEAVDAEDADKDKKEEEEKISQSRKGSLTAEELSESAEKEQEMRKMLDGYIEDKDNALWDDGEDEDEVVNFRPSLAASQAGQSPLTGDQGQPGSAGTAEGQEGSGTASSAESNTDRDGRQGALSPKSTASGTSDPLAAAGNGVRGDSTTAAASGEAGRRRNSSRVADRLKGLMETHGVDSTGGGSARSDPTSDPSTASISPNASSSELGSRRPIAGKKPKAQPRQSRVSLTEADRPKISILKAGAPGGPGSLPPPIAIADDEGVNEFLEKVPSGNTGLAEHGASEDSAPSRVNTRGGHGTQGSEGKGMKLLVPEGARGVPDLDPLSASEAKNGKTDAAQTEDADKADPGTAQPETGEESTSTTTYTTHPAPSSDETSMATQHPTPPPAEPEDVDRPITDADMAHTPLDMPSAGAGPAEIDLADAGIPLKSTDGDIARVTGSASSDGDGEDKSGPLPAVAGGTTVAGTEEATRLSSDTENKEVAAAPDSVAADSASEHTDKADKGVDH